GRPAPQRSATLVRPSGSTTELYGTPIVVAKSRADAASSSASTPRNRTCGPAVRAAAASNGSSVRHGTHHEPQRLTTSGRPRSPASRTLVGPVPGSRQPSVTSGRPPATAGASALDDGQGAATARALGDVDRADVSATGAERSVDVHPASRSRRAPAAAATTPAG